MDLLVDGQVPLGAGLSSSAALECAVAVALDDVAGLGLGRDDGGRLRLARACMRAENEIAGAPTGGMDQSAALRCRDGHALVLDCRDLSARHLPFDPVGQGLEVLVMDTRAHHALVDGQYGSRRDACAKAARLLGVHRLGEVPPADLPRLLSQLPDEELRRRVRHVVTEVARVAEVVRLLGAGRVREVGPLLDASHASLRLDFEVSCEELDVACAAALDARGAGCPDDRWRVRRVRDRTRRVRGGRGGRRRGHGGLRPASVRGAVVPAGGAVVGGRPGAVARRS